MGTLSVDKLVKTSSGAAEFTLPATDGIAGQVWQTDGAGQLSVAALAADTVTATQIAANAVTTTEIIDNAVTGAKIAMGSDAIGDLLYYNGTDYVRLAAGTADQLLTSAGAAAPTWAAAAGGGKVLQVLQATKTDTQTTTTAGWVDVTGLSIAITPAATTSKILVSAMVLCVGTVGAAGAWVNMVRDSTEIAIATGAGSRTAASSMGYAPDGGDTRPMSTVWLDSPSTTSATTYKVQFSANGTNTAYINRTQADGNSAAYARGVSTITVMEIGA